MQDGKISLDELFKAINSQTKMTSTDAIFGVLIVALIDELHGIRTELSQIKAAVQEAVDR